MVASKKCIKESAKVYKLIEEQRVLRGVNSDLLGHASHKTTMDMYGTLSIDEMQQESKRRLKIFPF